jgi:hypothetical protein
VREVDDVLAGLQRALWRLRTPPHWCEGRRGLARFLSQIACLRALDSGEDRFGFGWVSFEVEVSSPLAWTVVGELASHLNAPWHQQAIAVVFRPVPGPGPQDPPRWEIAATVAGLDPATVEQWLRVRLPRHLGDEMAWQVPHAGR